jgi:hypothetical protein
MKQMLFSIKYPCWVRWLTPVILGIQEAEIRKIMILS